MSLETDPIDTLYEFGKHDLPDPLTLTLTHEYHALARALSDAPLMSYVENFPDTAQDGEPVVTFAFWLPVEVTNYRKALAACVLLGYDVPTDCFTFADEAKKTLELRKHNDEEKLGLR
jgi:hypothetical protein